MNHNPDTESTKIIDQDKPKRKTKGIWIPIEIWEHDNLSLQEKVFIAEIDSLDNNHGCWASNDYFSKHFNLSKNRVSSVISSLVNKGFLTNHLIYKANSKEISRRILKVTSSLYPSKTVATLYPEAGGGYTRKQGEGIPGNAKDNSLSFNSLGEHLLKDIGNVPAEQLPNELEKETSKTNLNKTLQRKATKVLSKLNQLGSKPRGFRPVPENLKYIISRLKDGFSVQDCFQVLETKIHDPWFEENPKLYNPETLFRPKNFEKYLNEKIQDYEKKQPGVANGSGISGNIDYSLRPGRDKKIKVDKTNWGKYDNE